MPVVRLVHLNRPMILDAPYPRIVGAPATVSLTHRKWPRPVVPTPMLGPQPKWHHAGCGGGVRIWMEGRYVFDLEHGGWAELRPLYRWGLN